VFPIGRSALTHAPPVAGPATGEAGRARTLWFADAALTLDLGIWAMHFVVMLASRLSPLASRLSPLASRLSPLASRLSPLASRLPLPVTYHPADMADFALNDTDGHPRNEVRGEFSVEGKREQGCMHIGLANGGNSLGVASVVAHESGLPGKGSPVGGV